MQMSKFLMAVSAISMAAAPALAAPVNPAASLSIGSKSVRAGSHHGKSQFTSGILIAVLAVVAVGAGIAVVASDDDDSDSN